MLLGSFDDNANTIATPAAAAADASQESKLTLLDVDLDPVSATSLEEVVPLKDAGEQVLNRAQPELQQERVNKEDIVKEFDVISAEDDDDKEFELLAAESVTKTPIVCNELPIGSAETLENSKNWNAFNEKYDFNCFKCLLVW